MLNNIEQAVIAFITEQITAIRSSGVQKDTRGLLVNPALSAGCMEGGFERIGKQWKHKVSISILLSFQHAKGEAARRNGSNPLIESIFQLLLDEDLGLSITPLEPVRWREITDETAYDEGKNEYLLQFSTSFNIKKLAAGEAQDLLGIAIDYLLEPGNNTADAQDELTP